jgi:hypothetical protein
MYGIDQASRGKDIERAVRMMLPDAGARYVNWLRSSGDLELQRREKWQAVWTEQENKVDPHDPYTIRIIGEQEITRVVGGGQVKKEKVQLALNFKLVADLPRADRNLRSGFLIASFDGTEISRTQVPVD